MERDNKKNERRYQLKFISHRGNIDRVNENLENNPNYIQKALDLGYDVEIDVRLIDENLFLGHDNPDFEVSLDFLKNEKLWCHAKNLDALDFMIKEEIQCFWHQEDDYTITSTGKIWAYPGKPVTNQTVIVLMENFTINEVLLLKDCYGICADNILEVKNILKI